MYKKHLLNNIEKEINVCCRLYIKVPRDQMHFRPKEGVRTILELLQYLSFIGSLMPGYWLNKDVPDFTTFFEAQTLAAKTLSHEQFLPAMDAQMATIKDLFSEISEEDLLHREITYPWGGEAAMGEAIIATSVKWLSAYKLQLFLFIKLCGDEQLTTADAWA
jgi:hypothetical protein